MPLLEQVLVTYPKDIKVVFKNFPLRERKYARKAAIAALAAMRQGKFWEYHDKLFTHIDQMNDGVIQQLAEELGLNMVEFNKSLNDPGTEEKVDKDIRDGTRAGVKGAPTVFINGRHLGNLTMEGFQASIAKELEPLKK